ncbi:hypothetical protein ABZ918_34240, partial [Streptomyces viridosporus]
ADSSAPECSAALSTSTDTQPDQQRRVSERHRSAEDLEAVAYALNNRSRRILGWKTPAEVFDEQLRSLQQPDVASTG